MQSDTDPSSAGTESDHAPADDELLRCLTSDRQISIKTIVATGVLREATARRALAPTATDALGRALMGSLLLAVGAKDEARVQLQFRGDGPLRSLVCISEADGRVRGTVSGTDADPPPRADGPDVSAALGRGTLTVMRSHPRWKAPQHGTVPITNGEIATDLARYLRDSEQIPAAVGLGVSLAPDGRVDAAGGFLVQALPGADEAALARVEAQVRAIASPARIVRAGGTAGELMDHLCFGSGGGERHRSAPRFWCPCSRARALRSLSLLTHDELHELAEGDETQGVDCQFCGRSYQLQPHEVARLLTVH